MSGGHGVVSFSAALSLATLLVHPAVERDAAGGPAGVVELGNNPRKAILMNCAYPSVKPSIIHPSIYLIHTYIHTWCNHLLTNEDEHADQKCYKCPRAESRTHYIGCGVAGLDGSLCVRGKKKKEIIYCTFSSSNESVEWTRIKHQFIKRKNMFLSCVLFSPSCNHCWGPFACTFAALCYFVLHKYKLIRTVCWPKKKTKKQWHEWPF